MAENEEQSLMLIQARWSTRRTYTGYFSNAMSVAGTIGIVLGLVAHDAAAVVSGVLCIGAGCGIMVVARTFGARWKENYFCRHCGKHLSSHDRWQCGRCQHASAGDSIWTSFVHKCVKCGQAPLAVRCPHCDKDFFRGGKSDSRLWATVLDYQVIPIESSTPYDEELKHLNQQRDLRAREADILKKKIENARAERKIEEEQRLLDELKSPDFWNAKDDGHAKDAVDFVRRQELHARAWAVKEKALKEDSTLDDELKEDLIEYGRRFLKVKLDSMKSRVK